MNKKIKIFYPINDCRHMESPYVRSLINNISEMNARIDFIDGLDNFWKHDFFDFDIVHIMWPSAILDGHTNFELEKRLTGIKTKGKKIVATCHNLVPHYDSNEENIKSYDLVYSLCDEIYHLAEYSLNLFIEKYPRVNHKLLYHPVYQKMYNFIPSKEEGQRKLGLNVKYKYVLCFGQVRDKEEVKLIQYCAKKLKKEKVKFVVPSFMPYQLCFAGNFFKKIIKKVLSVIYYVIKKFLFPNIIFSLQNKVLEEDIPYYFSACDVGLIHRVRILNSGNLPLNYYFEKVVVGPNVGNVGYILNKTKNPVFDVSNYESVIEKIKQGFELQNAGLGRKNAEFASFYWREDKIAGEQLNYYLELICRGGY